jgi:hypothetical protein
MKKRIIIISTILLIGVIIYRLISVGITFGHAPVCPEGEEWSSHQSPPFTPVEGAIEYCFFAGSHQTDTYPDGGFGQEGACTKENIQRCDLSHWSYRLSQLNGTPSPTPEPTLTPTPTPTITPSPTPTVVPTLIPTPKLEEKKEVKTEIKFEGEGEIFGPQK